MHIPFVNRHAMSKEANFVFAIVFLAGSLLGGWLEIATNRVGVLFITWIYDITPTNNAWLDNIAWGGGAVPLCFLVYILFKYTSGHYERKQIVHTEKLDEFDKAYTAENPVSRFIHKVGIIVPMMIVVYGFLMDIVGVYGALHPKNWILGILAVILGIFIAALSTVGTPELFLTAFDMLSEAKNQKLRTTVDLSKRTLVPRQTGPLGKGAKAIGNIGSGNVIAAPSKKSPTTTI